MGWFPEDFEVMVPNFGTFFFAGPFLLMLGAILLLAGIIFGVSLGARLIGTIVNRHCNVLWLREETQRFVVVDRDTADDHTT